MIYEALSGLSAHRALHPHWAAVERFLARPDLAGLPNGRHEVDGAPGTFALVSRTQGRGAAAAKLEIHRKYWDVQMILSGADRMGWKALAECREPDQPFSADDDIGFYRDAAAAWLDVPAGYVVVFAPADAHAPLAGEGPVHKVVVKLLAHPA